MTEETPAQKPFDNPWKACCIEGCCISPSIIRNGQAYCSFHVNRTSKQCELISAKLKNPLVIPLIKIAHIYEQSHDELDQSFLCNEFNAYAQRLNDSEQLKLQSNPNYIPMFVDATLMPKEGADYVKANPLNRLFKAFEELVEYENNHQKQGSREKREESIVQSVSKQTVDAIKLIHQKFPPTSVVMDNQPL